MPMSSKDRSWMYKSPVGKIWNKEFSEFEERFRDSRQKRSEEICISPRLGSAFFCNLCDFVVFRMGVVCVLAV
jgi:hypothetical protein